jgi:protein gp37
MAGLSDIEWTDATWNPVAGCTMVSPGCTNCYAMRMAARLEAMGHVKYQRTTRKSGGRAVWTGQVVLDEVSLDSPLTWRNSRRIFVNSMSDLFQDPVPLEFVARVWQVMEEAHWHQFQILTKRPERMARLLSGGDFKVLPNVWLGTSIENRRVLDRLEALRATPAAVRFVSFEPLIGAVGDVDLTGIDWAIVGGESGPKARQMQREWIDQIRHACHRHDVAFFFKQWGGANKRATGRILDGRTWDDYPKPLPLAQDRSQKRLAHLSLDG